MRTYDSSIRPQHPYQIDLPIYASFVDEQLQLRSGGIEADTALPGVLIEGLAG